MTSSVLFSKKTKARIVLLLFAACLQGCRKPAICDCFKSTGKEITEQRNATPFHEVDLYRKVDLYFHRSQQYRITVTAGSKLINNIKTEINDGVLTIENQNKCNWVRDFNNTFIVDIYTPDLSTIEVHNSSGNIYFADTLISGQFLFESWGSTGDYHLKLNCTTVYLRLQTGPSSIVAEGKVGVGYLWNSGGGRFDALQLQADDIYSTNNGSNDLLLYPNKKLEAVIGYSGNIYIKGNPPVKQLEDNGSGKFITI